MKITKKNWTVVDYNHSNLSHKIQVERLIIK